VGNEGDNGGIMSKKIKEIPYGVSNFEDLKLDENYFIDKTRFISLLESYKYVFFIRPRRFGKSLFLSMLQSYYDIAKKDKFEFLFKDTDIGKNPTPEKNSYLIMRLDFSAVDSDMDKVKSSFEAYVSTMIHFFVQKYQEYFSDSDVKQIEGHAAFADKLNYLFRAASQKDIKLYIFIDEYDNFANNILSVSGRRAYEELTHGHGFFRHFFAVLKSGTSEGNSGLSRLFITGVSPVTLDDVTSGFNIGKNLSLSPAVNDMLGFTQAEVKQILEYYKDSGMIRYDIEKAMQVMNQWYNGYAFAEESKDSLFNPCMVLNFIADSILNRDINSDLPKNLIDQNVRFDYEKLKYLILINKRLNGNFDCLKSIIEDGKRISPVVSGFPLEKLVNPENFTSLLYYFGLLTFKGIKQGVSVLSIPNLTIRDLMYGYIRDAYYDVNIFRINMLELGDYIREMAWEGKWKQFFDFMAKEVKDQTSVRDYLYGEKVIQGFLLAYLCASDFLIPTTEFEMNKGYCDFFLEPFKAKYPDISFGYIIELKYIPRSKKDKLSDRALQDAIKKAKEEANQQIEQYANDTGLKQKYKDCNIIKLIVVYYGWEMKEITEVL
jgi:hypothetical protein